MDVKVISCDHWVLLAVLNTMRLPEVVQAAPAKAGRVLLPQQCRSSMATTPFKADLIGCH